MTHHLTNPCGFNKEGWITWKSVVVPFNADDVIVSMKGGLSPAKASCIRATEACQDPWIHSPSLKTNVTANLASLLLSISPQSKTRRRGKSHSMNDSRVFWYQRPPQQSGGNLWKCHPEWIKPRHRSWHTDELCQHTCLFPHPFPPTPPSFSPFLSTFHLKQFLKKRNRGKKTVQRSSPCPVLQEVSWIKRINTKKKKN